MRRRKPPLQNTVHLRDEFHPDPRVAARAADTAAKLAAAKVKPKN